jgi:hypothetical protein
VDSFIARHAVSCTHWIVDCTPERGANEKNPSSLGVSPVWTTVKLSRYRHAGAKGERSYSSYLFFTSALDESDWSALPRERAPVPIGQEAGWASEPVWTQAIGKSFASARE